MNEVLRSVYGTNYSTAEVAGVCGVKRKTVQKWIAEGRLSATFSGRQYHVWHPDLLELLDDRIAARSSRNKPDGVQIMVVATNHSFKQRMQDQLNHAFTDYEVLWKEQVAEASLEFRLRPITHVVIDMGLGDEANWLARDIEAYQDIAKRTVMIACVDLSGSGSGKTTELFGGAGALALAATWLASVHPQRVGEADLG